MATTHESVETQTTPGANGPTGGFGANEWLVDEMYERYLADPNAVDAAWHDFFADYPRVAGGRHRRARSRCAAPGPGRRPRRGPGGERHRAGSSGQRHRRLDEWRRRPGDRHRTLGYTRRPGRRRTRGNGRDQR